MITGIYQTTLGAQNHRSQQTARKGGGNTAYYDSYELPETVKLVPELFKEAGYFTTLGQGPDCRKLARLTTILFSILPFMTGPTGDSALPTDRSSPKSC